MKPKWEPNKRKPIREITTKKNYSGEASPYWDFMAAHQTSEHDGNPNEDVLANPDLLSDEETLHDRPISDDGDIRLQAIRETMAKLSSQQRRLVELCGIEGYSVSRAAELMNIKDSTAHSFLNRARKTIERKYKALKAADQE